MTNKIKEFENFLNDISQDISKNNKNSSKELKDRRKMYYKSLVSQKFEKLTELSVDENLILKESLQDQILFKRYQNFLHWLDTCIYLQ